MTNFLKVAIVVVNVVLLSSCSLDSKFTASDSMVTPSPIDEEFISITPSPQEEELLIELESDLDTDIDAQFNQLEKEL